MQALYLNADNTATGGVALDPAGHNVEVVKIIVGNPVISKNIYLYNENNVGNVSNTTGIVAKFTMPGSLATGQLPFTIDLTDASGHGIILTNGGTVMIDGTLQATVIYGPSQQESNTI